MLKHKERQAFQDALVAHRDQKYNDRPYIEHLSMVVTMLEFMGYDGDYTEEYRIVGWLHDIVEDQPDYITIFEIREEYGSAVADAVDAISRRKGYYSVDIFNDVEMKEGEHEYLTRVLANPIARVVKHADSCANLLMTRSLDSNPEKRNLYSKYLKAIERMCKETE